MQFKSNTVLLRGLLIQGIGNKLQKQLKTGGSQQITHLSRRAGFSIFLSEGKCNRAEWLICSRDIYLQ